MMFLQSLVSVALRTAEGLEVQLRPEFVGMEGTFSALGEFGMGSTNSWAFLPTSGICEAV